MATMLHLDSGANRSDESITRRLGADLARRWRAAHAGPVVHRDLAADPVPPVSTAYCALGRRVERAGQRPGLDGIAAYATDDDERAEWARTRPLIDELLAADVLVIGAPMYNFGVPAALKAWIDRITFPGAFLDASGTSRLDGTRLVVVQSRGGGSAPGSHDVDHAGGYLRDYFVRYGVRPDDVTIVANEFALAPVAPAMAGLIPQAERSLDAAERRLARVADELAGAVTHGRTSARRGARRATATRRSATADRR